MSPRISACRAVPREPTREAATTVLPWPGSSAWNAPSAAATRSAIATTLTVSSRVVIRSVNAPRDTDCTLAFATIGGVAGGVSASVCGMADGRVVIRGTGVGAVGDGADGAVVIGAATTGDDTREKRT